MSFKNYSCNFDNPHWVCVVNFGPNHLIAEVMRPVPRHFKTCFFCLMSFSQSLFIKFFLHIAWRKSLNSALLSRHKRMRFYCTCSTWNDAYFTIFRWNIKSKVHFKSPMQKYTIPHSKWIIQRKAASLMVVHKNP